MVNEVSTGGGRWSGALEPVIGSSVKYFTADVCPVQRVSDFDHICNCIQSKP